jgi:hypothetical protein
MKGIGNTIFLQFLVSDTILYTFFFFAYSMFSVIDELSMSMYINACNFHWILLSIQVNDGRVVITDPLDKEHELCKGIVLMLQR